MFKAICIKRYKDFRKGDIIRVGYGFNNKMYYIKGFKIGFDLLKEAFEENFLSFDNYFVVEKPALKRRFRKPKKQQLKVSFNGISEEALKTLYNCVFSYIELARQIDPSLITTFSYSIVSTLEQLEQLYTVLTEQQFIEAIKSAEQVFKGLYKTALSIEISVLPTAEEHEKLLDMFKEDSNIVGSFFKELNKEGYKD